MPEPDQNELDEAIDTACAVLNVLLASASERHHFAWQISQQCPSKKTVADVVIELNSARDVLREYLESC